MKKTLIASAVALATVSSTAFAMDPASELAARLDSMPTVYGNIQIAHFYEDDGNSSNSELADGGSTIGFKHKHEISPGLEGFLKAEFHFDADDQDSNRGLGEKFDEAFIGVKGGFGTVLVGSEDTVYEWADVVDIFEQTGGNGEIAPDSESNTIHYYTPKLGGVATIGVTKNFDNSGGSNYQIAAKADVGPATIVGAYAIGDEINGMDYEDTLALAVEVGIGDNVTVAGQYENYDDLDYFAVLGVFSAGANQFAASYELADNDGDEESYLTVQALHNMSDNMYVYVEYMMTDPDEGDETDLVAIGATYAF